MKEALSLGWFHELFPLLLLLLLLLLNNVFRQAFQHFNSPYSVQCVSSFWKTHIATGVFFSPLLFFHVFLAMAKISTSTLSCAIICFKKKILSFTSACPAGHSVTFSGLLMFSPCLNSLDRRTFSEGSSFKHLTPLCEIVYGSKIVPWQTKILTCWKL